MNKNSKIGIFDSGIGGVTVLKEILKVLPNEDYIYYSDSINNPYGDKNSEEIINICDNIVNILLEKEGEITINYSKPNWNNDNSVHVTISTGEGVDTENYDLQ